MPRGPKGEKVRADAVEGSIRAPQPSHRELNLVVRQLSPGLDLRHVRRGRPSIEERPCRLTRLLAGLTEGLPDIAVIGLALSAPSRHPVGQISRGMTSWAVISLTYLMATTRMSK